jgi:hypothetical protein
MRCTELTLIPVSLAMAAAVQCVVSTGGSSSVRATTCCSTGAEWRDARWTRLVAHQAADTIRREAFLPAPNCGLAGVGAAHDFRRAATIRREQDDLCPPNVLLWVFRSTTIAARRWRSSVFNSTVTPVRMRQTRTHRDAGESQIGLDCQFLSTRNFDWAWFNSRLDKLSRMMAIRFGQDYAVNS